jgi:hypothetical protein
MSNTSGGFLGRGVKIKGGTSSFSPFEWKPVDTAGNDLRNNIVPLPTKEPSAVLFQLLGTLVSYSEKLSGATDMMSGVAPGQNTPAETSRNTIEQGMMLFSGIYARMYRALRSELQKVYELNRNFLQSSPCYYTLTNGDDALLAEGDYSAALFNLYPAASPEAVSQTQVKEKALSLLQLAQAQPGFNMYLVTLNYLEAAGIENISMLYPDPAGPNALPAPAPQVDPMVGVKQEELAFKREELAQDMQLQIAALQQEASLNEAKISELSAKTTYLLSQADGVGVSKQIEVVNTQIASAKLRQESLQKSISLMTQATMQDKQLAHEKEQEAAFGNRQKQSSPSKQS